MIDRIFEISIVIIAILTFVCAMLTMDGCEGTMPDLAPEEPNWNVPPVAVPIYPFPYPIGQHSRIELWGPAESASKAEFLRGLSVIRNDCTADLWLSVECRKCYRIHDFWSPEDVPVKSTRCECGEWLIRYLDE